MRKDPYAGVMMLGFARSTCSTANVCCLSHMWRPRGVRACHLWVWGGARMDPRRQTALRKVAKSPPTATAFVKLHRRPCSRRCPLPSPASRRPASSSVAMCQVPSIHLPAAASTLAVPRPCASVRPKSRAGRRSEGGIIRPVISMP